MLALFHIPHYVCGGFAVQEHGYPRFTVDVDIIVPDVQLAREKLRTEILALQWLISSKLSTHIERGIDRVQDYADVVQLIKVKPTATRL